jgi:hypothetical protein
MSKSQRKLIHDTITIFLYINHNKNLWIRHRVLPGSHQKHIFFVLLNRVRPRICAIKETSSQTSKQLISAAGLCLVNSFLTNLFNPLYNQILFYSGIGNSKLDVRDTDSINVTVELDQIKSSNTLMDGSTVRIRT